MVPSVAGVTDPPSTIHSRGVSLKELGVNDASNCSVLPANASKIESLESVHKFPSQPAVPVISLSCPRNLGHARASFADCIDICGCTIRNVRDNVIVFPL